MKARQPATMRNKASKEEIMKNTFQKLAVLALIATFGICTPVYAEIPADLTEDEIQMIEKKREMRAKFKEEMKAKLGLSDEQQQKLQEHRSSHRGQAKQYVSSMKDLKGQLKAELEKEEFDVAKVRGIHEQLKTLKNKKADDRLESILGVRAILTAEQYKKFHEFKKDRKGKWGGRHRGSH